VCVPGAALIATITIVYVAGKMGDPGGHVPKLNAAAERKGAAELCELRLCHQSSPRLPGDQ